MTFYLYALLLWLLFELIGHIGFLLDPAPWPRLVMMKEAPSMIRLIIKIFYTVTFAYFIIFGN